MIPATTSADAAALHEELVGYVTVEVAGQLLGIPIERVHDVFVLDLVTPVPLASRDVAGLVNLRGRIVTAIDMRRRLGLPDAPSQERRMAVGIDDGTESFGLLVDSVGEVLRLPRSGRDDNPVNLPARWASLASGIHGLAGRLLVVVDVDAALDFDGAQRAAA